MKKVSTFLWRHTFIFYILTCVIVEKSKSQDITLFDELRANVQNRNKPRPVFIDPSIADQISYLENEGSEFDSGSFFDRENRMARSWSSALRSLQEPTDDESNDDVNKRSVEITKRNRLSDPNVGQRKLRETHHRPLPLDHFKNKITDDSNLQKAKKKRNVIPHDRTSRQKRQELVQIENNEADYDDEDSDEHVARTSNKRGRLLTNREKRSEAKNLKTSKNRNGVIAIKKRHAYTKEDKIKKEERAGLNENVDTYDNDGLQSDEDGERFAEHEHDNKMEDEGEYVQPKKDLDGIQEMKQDEEKFNAEDEEDEREELEIHNREKRHFRSKNEDLNNNVDTEDDEGIAAENEEKSDRHKNINYENMRSHSNEEDSDDFDESEDEESFSDEENEEDEDENERGRSDSELENRNEDYNDSQVSGEDTKEVNKEKGRFTKHVKNPDSDAERKKTEKYLDENEVRAVQRRDHGKTGTQVRPAERCGHESKCGGVEKPTDKTYSGNNCQRPGCQDKPTESPSECEMKPHHRLDAKNRCKPKANDECSKLRASKVPESSTKPNRKRSIGMRPKRLIWLQINPWRWRKHQCTSACTKQKGDCSRGNCKITPVK